MFQTVVLILPMKKLLSITPDYLQKRKGKGKIKEKFGGKRVLMEVRRNDLCKP